MTEVSSVGPLVAKAVVYKRLGGYDVVEIVEKTVRPPAAGEVRIRVKAAAVNPTDILLRDPGYGDRPPPLFPGMDAAGMVESVGPGVSRLRPGQEVMAAVSPMRPEGGAHAQYILAPAASVVPIPEGVSLAQAATLPMNGLTALRALDLAALEAGQVLAISGGAGLVAHYVIAAAKRQGVRIITDAKPEEMAMVRNHGADIVVERSPDFAGAIRRALPGGADALLDTAVLNEASFPALRDGGAYIALRGWREPTSERRITIKRLLVPEVLERTDWLELLRDLAVTGQIKLRVAGQYPLEQVVDAQRALAGGGLRGRLVIMY